MMTMQTIKDKSIRLSGIQKTQLSMVATTNQHVSDPYLFNQGGLQPLVPYRSRDFFEQL